MSDTLLEQPLPADLDAERTVLGVLLQRAEYLDDLTLKPSDFHLRSNGKIYQTIYELRSEGHPVEFASVSGRLREARELEQVGGLAYIASLTDGMPISDPGYYVARVRSKALQRQCLIAGQAIRDFAIDCQSGAEARDFAEHTITGLVDEGEAAGAAMTAGDIAHECLEQLEKSDQPPGVKTGLHDLDEVLVTLEPETLTIVGARTGNGKSAFGLSLALNVATAGAAVGFISLEMGRHSLTNRLLAMLSGLNLRMLRDRGNLTRADWKLLTWAEWRLKELAPIVIDDTRGLTSSQVCARIRRMHKQHNIALGIVDYLTRLRFAVKENMRHELGDAAKRFKDLSGELRIPIIALSQLSRASVTGGNVRKPQLSDLRESGNLEEDADNVIFVHREAHYHPTQDNYGLAEIIVGKQRQGPAPATVQVAFLEESVRFADLKWERKI